MNEATLSKRARKKQAREAAQTGSAPHPESSDTAKKNEPSTPSTPPDLDIDFKLRDGVNPFIDVLQKRVRNLTKRRVSFNTLFFNPYHI